MSVALLKQEISPRVRMVSLRGADGGRDAELEGASPPDRYPNWHGRWIFQFKHYRTSAPEARRAAVADFRNEVAKVPAMQPRVENYVFITSVAATGAPGRGLFDRFKAEADAASEKFGINVDIWDGLEVGALLITHSDVARQFTRRGAHGGGAGLTELHGDPVTISLMNQRVGDLSFDSVELLVSELRGADGRVLSPGAGSHLWRMYSRGDNFAARAALDSVIRASARFTEKDDRQRLDAAGARWVWVTAAAVQLKIGDPRHGLELLRGVETGGADPNLDAWVWNLRSIAFGKLEERARYDEATRNARTAATAVGNEWLAANVALRELHKASWAAAERGEPIANDVFVAALKGALPERGSIDEQERVHLRALEDAYLALHFTWQESEWSEAERAITSAAAGFTGVGDSSELTRILSERGRLHLLSSSNPEEAIEHLREPVQRRLLEGELSRARYDLLWLAQARRANREGLRADVCLAVAWTLHVQLFGSEDIDSTVLQMIANEIAKGFDDMRLLARNRRWTDDFLVSLVDDALGIGPTSTIAIIDLERLKRALQTLA